jgi:hypothetical protein
VQQALSARAFSGGGAALPNLSAWEYLISFRPPHSAQRSLERDWAPDWSPHHIEDAYGEVNLDYYPVIVSTLPSGYTVEALLEYIRTHFNSFIDTNISEFAPYDSAHATKWASFPATEAVVHIDMKTWGGWANPDDGSVVCAEHVSSYWIFSTIWTPGDFAHPVSGNRQFGYANGGDGGFIFFTQGADRTTGLLDRAMSDTVFGAADALWQSLQNGIAGFVNANGGSAHAGTRQWNRYDWPAVQAAYHRPTVTWL